MLRSHLNSVNKRLEEKIQARSTSLGSINTNDSKKRKIGDISKSKKTKSDEVNYIDQARKDIEKKKKRFIKLTSVFSTGKLPTKTKKSINRLAEINRRKK